MQPEERTVKPGDEAEIRLFLLNANNEHVSAPKDLPVQIEVSTLSGELLEAREVTIEAGEGSETFTIKAPNEVGSLEIRAKQPLLLDGGSTLDVRSQPSAPRQRQRDAAAKRTADRPNKSSSIRLPEYGSSGLGAKLFYVSFVSFGEKPSKRDQHNLALRYLPERSILADGKDAATVYVYLNQPATSDIQVYLHNSGGQLAANPLVVRKDEIQAHTTLTSQEAGHITVAYQGSIPKSALEADRNLSITFSVPITKLSLKAAPPKIPLVDQAQIVVRLLNNIGTPVATDEPREVSLDIESGRGEIDPKVIKIEASAFEGRASFYPAGQGQVLISASAKGFSIEPTKLEVTFVPSMILLLSLAGGIAGGLIGYWTTQNARLWRVAVGVLTGLVLYWACIFGLVPAISRPTVANELSAFALSVLGGWLGTKVFTITLNKLGVKV